MLSGIYGRLGREFEAREMLLYASQTSAWETGGDEAVDRALVERSTCNHHALAVEGFEERMFECLEVQIDEKFLNDPTPTFRELVRRAFLPQIRVESYTAQYRDQPRFQALLRRLDQRMATAAKTYEDEVGLQLAL